MRRLLLSLVLASIGISSTSSFAQTARAVAARAFPSLVLLVVLDRNGNPISLGSGFVVQPDLIATNAHVISGGVSATAKLVGKKNVFNVTGVVALDSAVDLALLEVKGVSGQVLPLGDSSKVSVGDEIYAVGNPQGLEGTISQGIVSAVRKLGAEHVLQITAPISPGSSGGPVLDASGSVVGIAVASYKGGQNLNFAIPSNYLSRLLAQPRSTRSLSAIQPQKRAKMESIGGSAGGGVVASHHACLRANEYDPTADWYCSFSLINKLKSPISKVEYVVILYSRDGQPVDTIAGSFHDQILPGLARRPVVWTSPFDHSYEIPAATKRVTVRTEIRVLNFAIVE